MTLPAYATWFNIVLYQGLWFAAVLGQHRFQAWLLLPIGLHLVLCRNRGREISVLLACTLFGSVVDSVLTLAGVFAFSPAPQPLPIPLWLVAIWAGFAATLRHSLSFLIDRPLIGVPVAAVLAPLSYLAAARLDAVELPLGTLNTYGLLLVIWAMVIIVLIRVVRTLPGERTAARTSTRR